MSGQLGFMLEEGVKGIPYPGGYAGVNLWKAGNPCHWDLPRRQKGRHWKGAGAFPEIDCLPGSRAARQAVQPADESGM